MSWKHISSNPQPKDFKPMSPASTNETVALEHFFTPEGSLFTPVEGDKVNICVKYHMTKENNTGRIEIDYNSHTFKPNVLYKIKLRTGEVLGFIYRDSTNTVEHYVYEV